MDENPLERDRTPDLQKASINNHNLLVQIANIREVPKKQVTHNYAMRKSFASQQCPFLEYPFLPPCPWPPQRFQMPGGNVCDPPLMDWKLLPLFNKKYFTLFCCLQEPENKR